ncbi:hypothetical protein NE686_18155 [Tissierella carlieri]|uniref:Uncharacterized protein n=1 Tax=Tissierella carlieri TaxID=689904 RepID=A0ABT1SEY7_9FIRM|nr:hypothetical protein [Tissierella carlieri]MCQ4925030.1 hypothetical protein [Tissierella carlieri]
MENKEKRDLLTGSVAIPVIFESFDDDKNYNKAVLGKLGQGMSFGKEYLNGDHITKEGK